VLRSVRLEVEPEFSSDDDTLTNRSERFANEFFICERSVNFGGIE